MPIPYILSCLLTAIVTYPAGSLFYPQVVSIAVFVHVYFESRSAGRAENEVVTEFDAGIFMIYGALAFFSSCLPIMMPDSLVATVAHSTNFSRISEYIVNYTAYVNPVLRVDGAEKLYLWTVFMYVIPTTIACSHSRMIRYIGYYMSRGSRKSLFSVSDKIKAYIGISIMFIGLDGYFKFTNVYMNLYANHWYSGIIYNFSKGRFLLLAKGSVFTLMLLLLSLSCLMAIPHQLRTKA